MNYPGFIGPSNVMASTIADNEETINFYFEPTAPGTGKSPGYLRRTPGLKPLITLSAGPVFIIFYQDGRGFAIGGTGFEEIFSSGTSTIRGTVLAPYRVPTISSNGTAGNQLFVTSGGSGYIYDLVANTLTLIADADFLTPSAQGVFIDGYFVNLLADSRTFQWSALEDGTTWDALDVQEISTASDNIISMCVSHRELWLMGSMTSQVWADIGEPDTPFSPIPGSLIQQGIWAPDSLVVIDMPFWLGQSVRGINTVYTAKGYAPDRISTHAIEEYLSSQERTDDAIGWSYQQDGHTFYALYGSTWDSTVVYDLTTGQWHKRALWDPTMERWFPDIPRCVTFGFGRVLAGDRKSPAIYDMNRETLTYDIVTV